MEHPNGHILRDAFARIATSVMVITTVDSGGRPQGITVGSAAALSLDPPLVLFCIGRGASTHGCFTTCRRFSANLLTEDQQNLAVRFATSGIDRFAGRRPSAHGDPPAVSGALATFHCRRHATLQAGDHAIVIGQVETLTLAEGRPLLYYDRRYRTLLEDTQRPTALHA